MSSYLSNRGLAERFNINALTEQERGLYIQDRDFSNTPGDVVASPTKEAWRAPMHHLYENQLNAQAANTPTQFSPTMQQKFDAVSDPTSRIGGWDNWDKQSHQFDTVDTKGFTSGSDIAAPKEGFLGMKTGDWLKAGGLALSLYSAMDQRKTNKIAREGMRLDIDAARDDFAATKAYRKSYGA